MSGLTDIVFACLEWSFIKNMATALSTVRNDAPSDFDIMPTTLRSCLHTFGKALAFLGTVLRSQSVSKNSTP